jgi:hypothetical protein
MNKKILIGFVIFLFISSGFFIIVSNNSNSLHNNINIKNNNIKVDQPSLTFSGLNKVINLTKTVNPYNAVKYSLPTGSTDIKLCQNGYGIYKNPNGYFYYFNISSGFAINTTTTNGGYNDMNYLYINGNTKYYIWVCGEPTSSSTAQFEEMNLNNNVITKITGGALTSTNACRSYITKSNLFGDLFFYGICYEGYVADADYGNILLNVFNLSSQKNTYYNQNSYVLENDSSCYYYNCLHDDFSGNNFIGRFAGQNKNYFIISYNIYGFQTYYLPGSISYAGNSYIFNTSINSFSVNNENYLYSHNTCIYNSIDKINFTTKKVITYPVITTYPDYKFSELNTINFYYSGSKIISNSGTYNLSISSPNQILFCKILFYYNINAIINYHYFIINILNINAENHLSQSINAYFYYGQFYYGLNFTFEVQSFPITFKALNYSIYSTNNTNILIQQSNYSSIAGNNYYYNYTIIYNSVQPINANPLNINEYLQPLTYILLILSMAGITLFVIKNNKKMKSVI